LRLRRDRFRRHHLHGLGRGGGALFRVQAGRFLRPGQVQIAQAHGVGTLEMIRFRFDGAQAHAGQRRFSLALSRQLFTKNLL
jgi:hypothetical protein